MQKLNMASLDQISINKSFAAMQRNVMFSNGSIEEDKAHLDRAQSMIINYAHSCSAALQIAS